MTPEQVQEIIKAMKSDTRFSAYSPESLLSSYATGDFSNLTNAYGQPFSTKDQQAALTQATKDTQKAFDQEKQYEQQSAEEAMKQKQAAYQDYLLSSGEKFQAEKGALDQTAANQGVLFSGGRLQKQQALQDTYAREQATNQRNTGSSIGSMARDFQYKYGNEAANNLSDYYKLGGNTYNAGVSTGGVGSSGLSRIYQPGNLDAYGTANVARNVDVNKRAAGLLWNKGNKLVASGINNKY